MGNKIINVLQDDIAYVELVDFMGDDMAVADAARVSYKKQSDQFSLEQNAKLIKYLADHNHGSPFEMVTYKFRIKAPALVWWQFVRHRMASYNATSGRYTPYEEDEFYVPKEIRAQDSKNKQASTKEGHIFASKSFIYDLKWWYKRGYDLYTRMLEEGAAKEQARLALPGWACYHEFIVQMNLRSLDNFFQQRIHDGAQWEIRQIAEAMELLVLENHPISYGALKNARR